MKVKRRKKIKFTSSRTKINAKLKIWESKCTAKVSQIAATRDPCAFKSVNKPSKEHLESKLYNMSITPEIGYTGSCMKIIIGLYEMNMLGITHV